MAEIPKVEGEVLLTNKGFDSVIIRRGEETLPCFNTHVKDANQWVRQDVMVIADTLAWCPCGRVFKRKQSFIEENAHGDWQFIGTTE